MPYQLVRDNISRDTVEAARQILEGAESGEIVGLTFGLMLKHRRFVVNVAGECLRDPTFSRGMLGAMDDELRELVQGNAGTGKTTQ